jgi:diguanylate cyclase (GGDEF)-like protein
MMTRDSDSSTVRLAIGLAVLGLCVGVATYVQQLGRLKQEAESLFQTRTALIGKFVAMQHDRVSVMRDLFVRRYQEPDARILAQMTFREHPDKGIFELDPGALALSGALTGSGPLPTDADLRREMAATLDMEAQILTAERLEPDIVWLYYQSARNFVYLSPRVPVARHHFLPSFYDQHYWQRATPALNPEGRLIFAGPYRDQGGKGWIMTIVKPVYVEKRFLGVVALDMRIDIFETLTRLGSAPGESRLLGWAGQDISRDSGHRSDGALPAPAPAAAASGWRDDGQGVLWLEASLAQGELRLVHRLPVDELHWAAARDSAATWLVSSMLWVIALMVWRLRKALAEVTRMTQIDPLTQVFNRRGFFAQAERVVTLAGRQTQPLAAMIMDIDFFKKINDSYGHAEGDRVLKEIGAFLQAACRGTDVVCRWGGEEFVVLMLLSESEDAQVVAERLRQQVQQVRLQPGDRPVTLSGGLVLVGREEPLERAIQRADELLYQAKQQGRDRIVAELSLPG